MKLSAPKVGTFLLALILAGLGIVSKFVPIPFVASYNFWFVAAGYILLLLGSFLKGI